jgi:prepilin-type N-terminal cleavage/methylation domain-containing protein
MNEKGFTLIELLVVIAIIAIVGVFAVVAVNSARSEQRDATRLSNVRLMQSALEDFFNETNMYPNGEGVPLGDSAVSGCLSANGFLGDCSMEDIVFMRTVTPSLSKGLDGVVSCGNPARQASCYTQTLEGAGYMIEFELENNLRSAGLQKGLNCASPNGMEAGICK